MRKNQPRGKHKCTKVFREVEGRGGWGIQWQHCLWNIVLICKKKKRWECWKKSLNLISYGIKVKMTKVWLIWRSKLVISVIKHEILVVLAILCTVICLLRLCFREEKVREKITCRKNRSEIYKKKKRDLCQKEATILLYFCVEIIESDKFGKTSLTVS